MLLWGAPDFGEAPARACSTKMLPPLWCMLQLYMHHTRPSPAHTEMSRDPSFHAVKCCHLDRSHCAALQLHVPKFALLGGLQPCLFHASPRLQNTLWHSGRLTTRTKLSCELLARGCGGHARLAMEWQGLAPGSSKSAAVHTLVHRPPWEPLAYYKRAIVQNDRIVELFSAMHSAPSCAYPVGISTKFALYLVFLCKSAATGPPGSRQTAGTW